jgi:hypothetical protein
VSGTLNTGAVGRKAKGTPRGVKPNGAAAEAPTGTPIAKPTPDMNQFKSKRGARAKEIDTLQSSCLPSFRIDDI